MTDDPAPATPAIPRHGHFVDLTPLRESPPFARLFAGRSIAGVGSQLTLTAVGLNVYDLTHSTFAVSLVGVFALVPTILAGLYGGMLADAFDRRIVALVSAIVSWAATLVIAALSWTHTETVVTLYALTVVSAVATTVLLATQSAIQPRLLPKHLLPAAAALSGISTGIAVTLGPALAGVLVAGVGFQWCYTVDAVLFVSALASLVALPPMRPDGTTVRPGLASLKSGVDFLRQAPNIRMSFFVDIVAMTFGQPRVLFPAVGALALGGGAITVGILAAAFAVGALLSSVVSGRLGGVRMQGVAIERSIQVYALCIAGFGVVLAVMEVGQAAGWIGHVTGTFAGLNLTATAIAAVLLAGAGAADNVSAIFRSTMMQSAAPDNVRGRLQGVFVVVVTGGPRIGDLYVGLLAVAGALWLPPVLGGLMILVLVGVLVRVNRGFRAYDAEAPLP